MTIFVIYYIPKNQRIVFSKLKFLSEEINFREQCLKKRDAYFF